MEEKESKPTEKKPIKRGRTPKRSEGLGDTIERITTATGIKAVVEAFSEATGIDCGCDARKEKLNKLFRYKKPECLTKEEYDFLGTIVGKGIIKAEQQKVVNTIYNRIFNDKVQPTSCGSCLKARIVELTTVYNAYEA